MILQYVQKNPSTNFTPWLVQVKIIKVLRRGKFISPVRLELGEVHREVSVEHSPSVAGVAAEVEVQPLHVVLEPSSLEAGRHEEGDGHRYGDVPPRVPADTLAEHAERLAQVLRRVS